MDLSNYDIPKKSSITSERQLVVKEFLEKLNQERGDYPQIRPGRLVKLFEGVKTPDLKIFLSQCNSEARTLNDGRFSKYFWWKIKVNKNNK